MRCLPIILLIVTSLFFEAKAFANNEVSATPPDIQKIISRGKLIVALYDQDTPPFFMQDATGHLSGYDVDLARHLASALGVTVEFHRNANTYDGVVEEVAKGDADIAISLLSITLPRALKVNFSKPYIYLPQALIYNRLTAAQKHYSNIEKSMINNPDVTLGALDKSSYVNYVNQYYPLAKTTLYNNIDQAVGDILRGKIFAFYLNEIEIKNWLANHPDKNLYLSYDRIDNRLDPIGIAVAWQDIHLLNWINWFLFISEKDGTLSQLQQHYFHK